MGRAPVAMAVVLALTLGGCGGTSHKKAGTSGAPAAPGGPSRAVALSISESGTTAKYTVPTSVQGGLVNFQLTNKGKTPHSAQLVRVASGHTVQQALQVLGSNSTKTPPWVHAEGGLGPVAPGLTLSAALTLPAGTYLVADVGGPRTGPPAFSQFTVTRGTSAPLPSTPVKITAAQTGKDRYQWRFSGVLQRGAGTVTFVSKGKQALHLIGVARLTKNVTKPQIIKALNSRTGGPPSFADPTSLYNTAAIDGGKSQTTPLPLLNPGRYVFYCPLTDRSGGKRHFLEGMLATVTVK
jgi:hypothetical protein